jgi:hypothetical protein
MAGLDTGPTIGYAVGVAGLVVAVGREMISAREPRRVPPVVVAHEVGPRHLRKEVGRGQAATVYLTNESAASAFNVRLGLEMEDVIVSWRHQQSDAEPSRVNVIGPGGRYPQGDALIEIVIPDQVIWGLKGNPDRQRAYWAYYQDPRGDWWYTRNPSPRSDDLTVKRVRSRRVNAWSRRNRRLDKTLETGGEKLVKAIQEMSAEAPPQPAG